MLTCAQYKRIKAFHQNELDGTPAYCAIPPDWMSDLFILLGDMALRNELLRAENENLRELMKKNDNPAPLSA